MIEGAFLTLHIAGLLKACTGAWYLVPGTAPTANSLPKAVSLRVACVITFQVRHAHL